MAHDCLVNNETREITTGKALVNSEGRTIVKGRTCVNGEGNNIDLGVPISSLSVGDIVHITVDDVPTEFMVMHHGIPIGSNYNAYDDPGEPSDLYAVTDENYSCNGTWLMAKDILEGRERTEYADYESSELHQYLNDGFLKKLDKNVQDIIKTVKIPYHQNGDNFRYGDDGLITKVFVLSLGEANMVADSGTAVDQDGGYLSYFEDVLLGWNDDTLEKSKGKRLAYYNGVPCHWISRTYYGDHYMCIGCYEEVEGIIRDVKDYIRPVFILPFETKVSKAAPHIVLGAHTAKNKYTMYVPADVKATTDIHGLEQPIAKGQYEYEQGSVITFYCEGKIKLNGVEVGMDGDWTRVYTHLVGKNFVVTSDGTNLIITDDWSSMCSITVENKFNAFNSGIDDYTFQAVVNLGGFPASFRYPKHTFIKFNCNGTLTLNGAQVSLKDGAYAHELVEGITVTGVDNEYTTDLIVEEIHTYGEYAFDEDLQKYVKVCGCGEVKVNDHILGRLPESLSDVPLVDNDLQPYMKYLEVCEDCGKSVINSGIINILPDALVDELLSGAKTCGDCGKYVVDYSSILGAAGVTLDNIYDHAGFGDPRVPFVDDPDSLLGRAQKFTKANETALQVPVGGKLKVGIPVYDSVYGFVRMDNVFSISYEELNKDQGKYKLYCFKEVTPTWASSGNGSLTAIGMTSWGMQNRELRTKYQKELGSGENTKVVDMYISMKVVGDTAKDPEYYIDRVLLVDRYTTAEQE